MVTKLPIALIVLGLVSGPSCWGFVIVPLSVDSVRSDAPAFGTTYEGPLNDGFAYDPLSPASVLPQTDYGAGPADLWHSPNGAVPTEYAVTFGDVYSELTLDFYARSDGPSIYGRDNNLTMRLYNGDWTTIVETISGVNIQNDPPHNRIVFNPAVEADRLLIVNPSSTNWSIGELRMLGVPEPSGSVFLAVMAVMAASRRRR